MTMFVPILGTIAMIASLFSGLGLLAQIQHNFKKKSCEGFAPPMVFSTIFIGLAWGAYGFAKGDPFIGYSNSFVFLLGCVLLYQLFTYRKKR